MPEITLDGISSCGIPCFACPSFIKSTCAGCRSEKKQKRVSKYGCRVRICSLTDKKVQFCFECEEFPCKRINKKLLTTHRDEKKYAYRYEIGENLQLIVEFGIKEGLRKLEKRWRCPDCGGRIQFYHYTCAKCGKELLDSMVKIKEEI